MLRRALIAATLAALALTGCEPGTGAGPTCDPDGIFRCDTTVTATPDAVGLGIAQPGTEWIVTGSGYSGPRGGPGRAYALCEPDWAVDHDQTVDGYGLWKEVDLGTAIDTPMPTEGTECPRGGTIHDDGPLREDTGS